jgi:hypothetical protein
MTDICSGWTVRRSRPEPILAVVFRSQQLKVLRESGFATVRAEGTRRVYAVDARPLAAVDKWLRPFRRFCDPALDALATEIARGKRNRKNRG